VQIQNLDFTCNNRLKSFRPSYGLMKLGELTSLGEFPLQWCLNEALSTLPNWKIVAGDCDANHVCDVFRHCQNICSTAPADIVAFIHSLSNHQMFNMFALLLDDALKPETPLIAPLLSGVAGLSASSSSKEDTLNILM